MNWIIHSDADLVVVDKPAGLLSVPGRGADKQDCAWSRVAAAFDDARVVHRLDMATSGLLLLARGAAMQRLLSLAFAERRVRKHYVAVVDGSPADDEGEVDLPLIADWPRRPRQKVDPVHGKPSLTRWRVLSRDGRRTRLLLEPVTGRSHQLRVHMAALGWPIVGDALYGRAGHEAPRLLLHAQALRLPHPVDDRALCFEAAAGF
jgi:tRNA pseudouridine32 synthase/23S rRNA pseudouridine746 synthase